MFRFFGIGRNRRRFIAGEFGADRARPARARRLAAVIFASDIGCLGADADGIMIFRVRHAGVGNAPFASGIVFSERHSARCAFDLRLRRIFGRSRSENR